MKRNELLFWATVLFIVGVCLSETTDSSPWVWPVYFTSGWFIGTALGMPRASAHREWPEKYETR